MAVTVLELPTALPCLGAAGAVTRADLPVTEWLPLLVLHNLIFVLPHCCCSPATWPSGSAPMSRSGGSATGSAGPPGRDSCGCSA
jgi:hypothetical protein